MDRMPPDLTYVPAPVPAPIPPPEPASPDSVIAALPAISYPTPSNLDSRKKVQKKTELLISASVAASTYLSSHYVAHTDDHCRF